MAIKAILHRIIVEPVTLEEYDETYERAKAMGITIAKVEDNRYVHTQIDQGRVVEIGPTAFLDYTQRHGLDIPVAIGDLVTYARHSGKTIKDPYDKDAKEVVVMNDEDIIAVYSENDNG